MRVGKAEGSYRGMLVREGEASAQRDRRERDQPGGADERSHQAIFDRLGAALAAQHSYKHESVPPIRDVYRTEDCQALNRPDVPRWS